MRLFTDILRDIRKGRVVEAASLALAEAVRAARFHGKPAEVTLKIIVKPKPGDNLIYLLPKVSTKIPQSDLPEGLFFADDEGDLLREDPTQTRMFAEAGRAAGDGERVDPTTGEVLTG